MVGLGILSVDEGSGVDGEIFIFDDFLGLFASSDLSVLVDDTENQEDDEESSENRGNDVSDVLATILTIAESLDIGNVPGPEGRDRIDAVFSEGFNELLTLQFFVDVDLGVHVNVVEALNRDDGFLDGRNRILKPLSILVVGTFVLETHVKLDWNVSDVLNRDLGHLSAPAIVVPIVKSGEAVLLEFSVLAKLADVDQLLRRGTICLILLGERNYIVWPSHSSIGEGMTVGAIAEIITKLTHQVANL